MAFALQLYEMNFRTYLEKHRDYRQLGRILTSVADGLKELFDLDYVHRDLKPENIVLNLRPLSVALIDFERAQHQCYET